MQQPMMQQPVKKSRPGGVTLLAVLTLIGGVFALLGGVAAIGLGGLAAAGGAAVAIDPSVVGTPDAAAAAAAATALGSGAMILGVILLVTALFDILGAIGLFGLKKWGLTLAVIAQLLNIGQTVYGLIQGTPLNVIGLAIPVLILLYLFTPNVRQAFA